MGVWGTSGCHLGSKFRGLGLAFWFQVEGLGTIWEPFCLQVGSPDLQLGGQVAQRLDLLSLMLVLITFGSTDVHDEGQLASEQKQDNVDDDDEDDDGGNVDDDGSNPDPQPVAHELARRNARSD